MTDPAHDYDIFVFSRRSVRGRRWYFHGKNRGNHEIIFRSEAYNREESAVATANAIVANAPGAAVHIRKAKG